LLPILKDTNGAGFMESSKFHNGIVVKSCQSNTIGFLSDAHGNYRALEKGLNVLRKAGAKDIFFLGDAVGYIPCVKTLEILAADGIRCQIGNHEQYLLGECSERRKEQVYKLSAVKAAVKEIDMMFIRTWPLQRVLEIGSYFVHLVHGSPRDPLEEYVPPDFDLERLDPYVKGHGVVMGHTHRAFIRMSQGIAYVNVGSCGLPRDEPHSGSVVLFSADSAEPWQIIRYDIRDETIAVLEEFDVASEVAELLCGRR